MLIRLHQAHKARESIVFKLGSAENKEDGQCVLEERSGIVHSRLFAGLIAWYEQRCGFC